MSFIPGYQVAHYLGNMNLFVIRETSSVREFGGISGFMHKFVAEVLALMRAHVAALGGNALLAFNLNQCVLLDNPNRNQAQCLINIAGDAVRVEPERNVPIESAWHGGPNGVVTKPVFSSGGSGGAGGGGSSGKSASPQSPKMRAKELSALNSKGDSSSSRNKEEVDQNVNLNDNAATVTSGSRTLMANCDVRHSNSERHLRVSECDDALAMTCKSIKNDLNSPNEVPESRVLNVLA